MPVSLCKLCAGGSLGGRGAATAGAGAGRGEGGTAWAGAAGGGHLAAAETRDTVVSDRREVRQRGQGDTTVTQ